MKIAILTALMLIQQVPTGYPCIGAPPDEEKCLAMQQVQPPSVVSDATVHPEAKWVLPHCAMPAPDSRSDIAVASCLLSCPAGYSLDSISFRCYAPQSAIDCKHVIAGDSFATDVCKALDGATWQLQIPASDAALNPTKKPCSPENHDDACIDTKARWLSFHIYGDQKSCEADERVSCAALAEYWIPIGKIVVYDNTPPAPEKEGGK